MILSNRADLGLFLVRVQPVTVREAMCCIISYYRGEVAAFAEPAFQLDDKFDDLTVLQMKLYTQSVVFAKKSMLLNEAHLIVLLFSPRLHNLDHSIPCVPSTSKHLLPHPFFSRLAAWDLQSSR
jgi:hypothetical protein